VYFKEVEFNLRCVEIFILLEMLEIVLRRFDIDMWGICNFIFLWFNFLLFELKLILSLFSFVFLSFLLVLLIENGIGLAIGS
jgi:hypothetical protein